MKIGRSQFYRLMGGFVVAAVVAIPTAAEAKKKGKNNRKKKPATKKGAASELPTVKKVDAYSITVGDKYYLVSEDTKITVNGNEAKLKQVKPGMQVSIAGGVSTYGRDTKTTIYKATRITASANKKPAGAKRKKK